MITGGTRPSTLCIVSVHWCMIILALLYLNDYQTINNSLIINDNFHKLISQEHLSVAWKMGYTRNQLLKFRHDMSPSYRLPTTTWNTIQDLGICQTPPTHRGTRGGKNRHRMVENQISTTDCKKPKCSPKNCTLLVWNAHSLSKKTTMFSSYILEHSADLVFITESWLKPSDDVIAGEVTPPGYKFFNVPRASENDCGGIAAIVREEFGLRQFPTGLIFTTFEHACFTDSNNSVYFFIVYRPPPSKENRLKTSDYLREFDELIEFVNSLNRKVLLAGDFNVHVDIPTKYDSSHVLTTLAGTGFVQHVVGPTHKDGHTLDLVISRETEHLITSCITGPRLSDHHVIHCTIEMLKPEPKKTLVTTRKLRDIDLKSFESDLSSQFESHCCTTADQLVDLYQCTITRALDKYAPVRSVERTCRPRQPWYNDQIHEARRLRRKYERAWRKSKSDAHRELYVNQRNLVNNLLDEAKQRYYKDQLEGADTKTVFKTVNTLLNRTNKVLPVYDDAGKLANEFGLFYSAKVSKIYQSIECELSCLPPADSDPSVQNDQCNLVEFDVVSNDDIMKYIMSSPAKSCSLDQVPTWFIKQNPHMFVPVITDIVNLSFSTGVFPSQLKHAVITPVIKKQNLDACDLKNYRPVSNIPYLSKVIERHAVDNISRYVSQNELDEPLQSAYKTAHSTETALLKVKNDIMECVSQRKGVFLALLDLSAAFDTVNHQVLLSRLSSDFGIQGTVLKWIRSYLTERTTSVCVDGVSSEKFELRYGLPQGSIMGPQQFLLYTTPIGKILRKYDVRFHFYADDIQLYTMFDPRDHASIMCALSHISLCIDEVRLWMTTNFLKFNEDKTEFFIAIAEHLKCHLPPVSLRVGDKYIPPADKVRNLGVVFDSAMCMESQITSLCSGLNLQLRNITRIRKYLDYDTCHLVVRALVLSRLDYGNVLLFGSTSSDLQRLQRIQNWAAKLVHRARKHDHATPYLKELHWLPVRERITFKTMVYVYKCLHGLAPGYLSSCLHLYHPARSSLRSASDTTLLSVPVTRLYLHTSSNRTFSYAAPNTWNALPQSIRNSASVNNFKKSLKTQLFMH